MAISVVQRTKTGDTTAAGSLSASFPSSVTSGHAIIVIAAVADTNSHNLSTPSDGINTYSLVVDYSSSNVTSFRAWIAYGIVGGSPTITVSDNFKYASMVMFEVAGLASSAAFDGYAVQIQASVTSLDSTALSTRAANELLLGVSWNTDSNGPPSGGLMYTAGSGYSNLQQNLVPYVSIASEEKIVSSTGNYNATFTVPTNNDGLQTAILGFADTTVSTIAKTQTSVARITASGSATQTAKASIATPLAKTQTGTSRITGTRTSTQTAKASIAPYTGPLTQMSLPPLVMSQNPLIQMTMPTTTITMVANPKIVLTGSAVTTNLSFVMPLYTNEVYQ